MRAQIRAALSSLLLAAVVGCTAASSDVDPRELSRYVHQLSLWAPQEAEVGRAVRRILATEFADEAEVRRQVVESRPRVEAQLEKLRAYKPRGAELADIHASYVEAWEVLSRGYDDIIRGFDEGDQATLGRGRRALLAWRNALPATAKRVRELGAATERLSSFSVSPTVPPVRRLQT
ncbi:MAG TPA: hypothetical protein VNO26_04755 [Candidatus Limnocylindria bacterium]|nr:hypothetical protein [Candidatus Limnocylindria bacterium]